MKTKTLILAAVLSSAITVCAFAQQNKGATAWMFSNAKSTKQGVEVPTTTGVINSLTFPLGTAIASDAEALGGKVVLIDGTQKVPGISLRSLEAMDAVQIKMKFKPAAQGADSQTLLRLAGSELRFNRLQQKLEFIVWYMDSAEKKFVITRTPMTPGAWNAATATYKAGKLTLTVGKESSSANMPAGTMMLQAPASARVGFTDERPFTGALAELSIGAPM
jgi:hypothetical protein